jgi:hypothetical protein
MQALFMNLVPPNSHFLFNSGPKKALSLSLDVKCDQQTHKENVASNYGINLKKIIQQSPITILPMFFCWGIPPLRLKLLFAGFGGFFMDLDYGKSKCYWFGLWD